MPRSFIGLGLALLCLGDRRAPTAATLVLPGIIAGKHRSRRANLPPLVTFGDGGPTDEFKDWDWDRIRDEIYRGRGA